MDHGVMVLCGYIACIFLGALAGTIVVFVWTGKIDLQHLVSEANHEASMSRFQLLIFTFVVAIGILELLEKTTPPGFPEIPNGVLTLLGISATTYAVGKGISYSQPETLKPQVSSGDADRAEAAANKAEAHAADAKSAADAAKTAASKPGI